jgi:phage FluMu protein Com
MGFQMEVSCPNCQSLNLINAEHEELPAAIEAMQQEMGVKSYHFGGHMSCAKCGDTILLAMTVSAGSPQQEGK